MSYQKDHLDELAESLELPDEYMAAFRMGYWLGKEEAIEDAKKIAHKVFHPETITEDVIN